MIDRVLAAYPQVAKTRLGFNIHLARTDPLRVDVSEIAANWRNISPTLSKRALVGPTQSIGVPGIAEGEQTSLWSFRID